MQAILTNDHYTTFIGTTCTGTTHFLEHPHTKQQRKRVCHNAQEEQQLQQDLHNPNHPLYQYCIIESW